MKLSPTDLDELAQLAIEAATQAGEMIAVSRPQEIEHKEGGDSLGAQVVTEIDRRSERIILDVLGPTLERFELGLLTEEQPDDGGRLTADYFWCIDPIDGTLPFINGTPGYAVSIALVGRDGTPWIGVAYDPVGENLFHAVSGVGAFKDGSPLVAEPAGDTLPIFQSHRFSKRDDYEQVLEALEQIAHDFGLDGVEVRTDMGAVMKACTAITTTPACYFSDPVPTGGSLWDFAATACLFAASGRVVSDLYGEPLELNRADSTYANHRGVLFATNAELAARILAL